MSDVWYYAEGDQTVGPLSLDQLIMIFSRVPDARSVLVWRSGFESWQEAENVPEIAKHVIKPPPVPITPPPIPRVTAPPVQLQASQTVIPQAKVGESGISQKKDDLGVREAWLSQPIIPEARIDKSKTSQATKDLVGIGGWLILVAIGLVLGSIKLFVGTLSYLSGIDAHLWIKFPAVFYGEAFLNFLHLALILWTTYLFFGKSHLFPRFFVYLYIAAILIGPLDLIWSAIVLSAYTGKTVGSFIDNMVSPKEFGQWIAVIISAALWIPYIKFSKRVANTFVNEVAQL